MGLYSSYEMFCFVVAVLGEVEMERYLRLSIRMDTLV